MSGNSLFEQFMYKLRRERAELFDIDIVPDNAKPPASTPKLKLVRKPGLFGAGEASARWEYSNGETSSDETLPRLPPRRASLDSVTSYSSLGSQHQNPPWFTAEDTPILPKRRGASENDIDFLPSSQRRRNSLELHTATTPTTAVTNRAIGDSSEDVIMDLAIPRRRASMEDNNNASMSDLIIPQRRASLDSSIGSRSTIGSRSMEFTSIGNRSMEFTVIDHRIDNMSTSTRGSRLSTKSSTEKRRKFAYPTPLIPTKTPTRKKSPPLLGGSSVSSSNHERRGKQQQQQQNIANSGVMLVKPNVPNEVKIGSDIVVPDIVFQLPRKINC